VLLCVNNAPVESPTLDLSFPGHFPFVDSSKGFKTDVGAKPVPTKD